MVKGKIRFLMLAVLLGILLFANTIKAGDEVFQESYYVNRSKACVHYFFSLFEKNPRDANAIADLLVDEGLDMVYPWGELKSKDEVRKWINDIPNEFYDAHHINDFKVVKTSSNNYSVVLDIVWQNKGNEGKFDSAHLVYKLELVDDGGRFVKIKKLHSQAAGK